MTRREPLMKETRDELGRLVSERRLFETATGEIVEQDDERARVLLIGKGGLISPPLAARLGLPYVAGGEVQRVAPPGGPLSTAQIRGETLPPADVETVTREIPDEPGDDELPEDDEQPDDDEQSDDDDDEQPEDAAPPADAPQTNETAAEPVERVTRPRRPGGRSSTTARRSAR